MTLIVASLFLPYTVEFEVSQTCESQQEDFVQTPPLQEPAARLPPLVRPALSKQVSAADSTSILKSMAAKKQQLHSPEMYASANNSKLNLTLNEDDLSRASVEDFFYHHPKMRRSSNAQSQYSSGTATPLENDAEKAGLTQQPQLPHHLLLRSALDSSTYIQPRARTPPVMNSSAVIDPTKKELQTPSLKVIPRNQSSSNLRPQASYNKSSLYKLASKGALSSSENISTAALVDDSGIEDYTDDSHIQYDIPEKVTPYGGSSHPDVNKFVTNRSDFFASAPFEVVKLRRGNISLVKAVETAINSNVITDDQIWIGTVGMPSDEVPDITREKINEKLQKQYRSKAVFIDDVTFQGHYKSFCKQILWPSLHYQIPDNPKSKVFEEHSWKYYQKVNEMFAKKIISTYKKGDVIWIHDYHLLLLPQLIRKEIPDAKIGLFLHVSFPSSEVFRCFAQRNNLLEGMLGANVISFQTEEYVRHFVQTCNRLLLSDFTKEGIKYDSRTIKINHIPVGIDAKSLRKKVETSTEVSYWQKLIKQRWPNKKLIVTRDKVDKIRGIKHKLLAYEKFLTKNPQYLDEVILIQICLPNNNQDEDLEGSLSTIVDRINAKSNNISISQPVVYLNQDIDFEQYLALLTEANTFIVSTMREGMNLTCHEFIVSTYNKHSPLILSEFTGSASILKEGAILINPWDIKQVSMAFEEAITKPEKQKIENWELLNKLIHQHDSNDWVKKCVDSILSSWGDQACKIFPSTLTTANFRSRLNKSSAKRVIVFNLENLSSYVQYENSKLNAVEIPRIFSILSNFTSDPKNAVYVMSYFKKNDLSTRYSQVSNLGFMAENGGYVKIHDSSKWYAVNDETLTWKPAVEEYVNSIVERLPNSSIEIEDCTIRFHTENVRLEDVERKTTLTGELITHINDVFANKSIHATLVNDVVVIQQIDLPRHLLQLVVHSVSNKNSIELLGNYQDVPPSPSSASSFTDADESVSTGTDNIGLLCIIGGQSPTDELLFKYGIELENSHKVDELMTVEVGKAKTSLANQYVGGVNELLNILKDV